VSDPAGLVKQARGPRHYHTAHRGACLRITLSDEEEDALQTLIRRGTHGDNRMAVMRRLILDAVQEES